jgi:hypothetical protein
LRSGQHELEFKAAADQPSHLPGQSHHLSQELVANRAIGHAAAVLHFHDPGETGRVFGEFGLELPEGIFGQDGRPLTRNSTRRPGCRYQRNAEALKLLPDAVVVVWQATRSQKDGGSGFNAVAVASGNRKTTNGIRARV